MVPFVLAYERQHAKQTRRRCHLQGCSELFPTLAYDNGRPGRGGMAQGWEYHSGKFGLVADMLAELRRTTDDRIVIVSNYTQTLDLFSQLCRERGVG